jgi:hypothetical protein
LHPDADGETTGTAFLPAALKRAARGGWFLLLVAAILLASAPQRPAWGVAPAPSGQRVVTSTAAPFVAVIPQPGFYDLASGPRATHEWRTRKPAHHAAAQADGAALAPPAAAKLAETAPDRPQGARFSALPRRPAFRHFDARGPPTLS